MGSLNKILVGEIGSVLYHWLCPKYFVVRDIGKY